MLFKQLSQPLRRTLLTAGIGRFLLSLLPKASYSIKVKKLNTPTLMIHADRAASGSVTPKKVLEGIAAKDKRLVWLGDRLQFQFYEERETIDRAVSSISEWFRNQA